MEKTLQLVLAHAGEIFCLEVHESSGAGYLLEPVFNKEELKLIRTVSLDAEEALRSGLIGAGNWRRFELKALKEGVFEFRAEERRPWEKEEGPARVSIWRIEAIAPAAAKKPSA